MSATAHEPAYTLDNLVSRSHAIGADASLVIGGGGNTSAKGEIVDQLGRRRMAMWVKGSGAELSSSDSSWFPALWMDELLPLRGLDGLSDDEMIRLVRNAMVDASGPRPSIEALLHAFLPFTHVDHVHADAICALTNHAHGREAVLEALGDRFAYVDWLRPGFTLARIVGDLAAYDGVVLAHHGLVTWAEDSDTCLRRTLETVAAAAAYLRDRASTPAPRAIVDMPEDELERLLLRLRGLLSRKGRRVLRVEPRLRAVADHPAVAAIVAGGVASADQMLAMKPRSLLLATPENAAAIAADVESYEATYAASFEADRDRLGIDVAMHDPAPRVALVAGLGAITTGNDLPDAVRVAEVAVHAHGTAALAFEAFGDVQPLSDADTFDFEYWPMELYKLTLRAAARPFAGTIHIVTGAASGIGRTIALELAKAGASVIAADLDGPLLETVAAEAVAAGAPAPSFVVGDQSREDVATETVRAAVRRFGGLDGVVINAGIGVAAPLEELELARWQRGLEVNLTSGFLLTREALKRMRSQGIGGSLVYVASKNAFAPGAGFGGYSVSKAGMLQLMRIAALEGGPIGVRANAVNPDAVFDNSGLWSGGLREQRAAEHGIRPEELEEFYANRNLLHRRVTTEDVARAVLFLLSEASSRTTGSVIPVDGGVAAAFPR